VALAADLAYPAGSPLCAPTARQPTPSDSDRNDHPTLFKTNTRHIQPSSLQECPGATLVTIPDTGHFALNQKPAQIAEIALGALSGTSRG
jgi:pimeloyl-ACP methyl ester carboxylesterase